MKLIDNILYIEFAELEACGVPRTTLVQWVSTKDPQDKRKALYNYENLKPKYQETIIKKYGDPYTYVHNQVIKTLLRADFKALDFYTNYRHSGNISLPANYIKEYSTAASWLNLLNEVDTNWSKHKKALCMQSKPQLYEAVCRIFENENIKLPKVYVPLKRKMVDYKAKGYSALVSAKFGNTNSKKVKDELNSALLLEMISHPSQYSDLFIAEMYNKGAVQLGFKSITSVTVGNYRHNNAVEVDGSRYGKDVWYNKFGKNIGRKRPDVPLVLINSDDNELDIYFKTEKKGKEYHYYRPCVYVVIDAFNDYPLGYAIGDQNTKDLIRAAYLDAANHVKQLTGGRYFWQQIQTDRWGIDREAKNDWSQYFSNQAEFSPTMLGNSRGKVIEQSFRGHWSAKLKELFPTNYSGYNITAKTHIDRDWLEANKKNFPHISEAEPKVAQFINALRHLVIDKATGLTRQQQWLTAFETASDDKKRLITDEQHLMMLGYDHINQYNGQLELNTLSNKGLTPIIGGIKRVYEVPKAQYLDTIGKTCKIKYDPYDLSAVLAISTDERTRLLCTEKELMPMAKADYNENSSLLLNSLIGEKRSHVKQLAGNKEARRAVLQRELMDAQSLLTAGVINKELKHQATRLIESGMSDLDDDGEIDIRDLM